MINILPLLLKIRAHSAPDFEGPSPCSRLKRDQHFLLLSMNAEANMVPHPEASLKQ
jgi:hypothetical protein